MLARYLLPAAAALLGLATAQVHTDCNPLERDDCPSNPALGTEHSWNFNVTPHNELWEQVVGPMTYDNENGAKFTISKQGESPTIRTKFYFFFGRVEFMLKAASGQGIVSSMMLLSDDLDEIDWEFIGTNTTHGSTNFFGKGIEDYTNGEWHGMPVSPQDDFHNYTTVWTEEKMDFYIDEELVRTIIASETSHEGNDTYPQTPMRMSLGIWAGGDPSLNKWTREWAGGDTNFDEAPFDMYVKSARIEDYSSGKEYIWGDRSGDWESIEIVEGNSTALEKINEVPIVEKSLNEKFNELPEAAKIAIYAGGGTVAALLIAGLVFYCIKQRRRGAAEAKLAEDRANNDRMELAGLKKAGIDPDAFTEHGHEYNAREMTKGGTTYTALEDDHGSLNEKVWGGAGVAAAGAAGAGAGAMMNRSNTYNSNSSYHDVPMSPHSPRTPGSPGFPPVAAAGGMGRSDSPGRIGSPQLSRMGSPGPQQAYGASRMNSPVPQQAYGDSRMGSPGPQQAYGASRMRQGSGATPMNAPNRSFSENHQAPYGASRMDHNGPMYPTERSYSAGPGRMNSPGAWSGYRQ